MAVILLFMVASNFFKDSSQSKGHKRRNVLLLVSYLIRSEKNLSNKISRLLWWSRWFPFFSFWSLSNWIRAEASRIGSDKRRIRGRDSSHNGRSRAFGTLTFPRISVSSVSMEIWWNIYSRRLFCLLLIGIFDINRISFLWFSKVIFCVRLFKSQGAGDHKKFLGLCWLKCDSLQKPTHSPCFWVQITQYF